jgi:hypothetical protein
VRLSIPTGDIDGPIAGADGRTWVVLDARDGVSHDDDLVGEEVEPVCEQTPKHGKFVLLARLDVSSLSREWCALGFLWKISTGGGVGGMWGGV